MPNHAAVGWNLFHTQVPFLALAHQEALVHHLQIDGAAHEPQGHEAEEQQHRDAAPADGGGCRRQAAHGCTTRISGFTGVCMPSFWVADCSI